jgi:hypothetical protein
LKKLVTFPILHQSNPKSKENPIITRTAILIIELTTTFEAEILPKMTSKADNDSHGDAFS